MEIYWNQKNILLFIHFNILMFRKPTFILFLSKTESRKVNIFLPYELKSIRICTFFLIYLFLVINEDEM